MFHKFFSERRFKHIKMNNPFSYSFLCPCFEYFVKLQYTRLSKYHVFLDKIKHGFHNAEIILDESIPNVKVFKPLYVSDFSTINVLINDQPLHDLLLEITRGEVHMENIIEFNYINSHQSIGYAEKFKIKLTFHRPAEATLFKLSI